VMSGIRNGGSQRAVRDGGVYATMAMCVIGGAYGHPILVGNCCSRAVKHALPGALQLVVLFGLLAECRAQAFNYNTYP